MANRINVTSQIWPPNGQPGGLSIDFSVAITADGDVVDTGAVLLAISNTDTVTWTVTVLDTALVQGLAVANLVATVAAGKTALIGPLPQNLFGQPAGANQSGGNDQYRAYVNYTSSGGTLASLKRAAVKYR